MGLRGQENHLGTPEAQVNVLGLDAGEWEVPTNIGALQFADLTPKPLFDKACAGGNSSVGDDDKWLYLENGIFYTGGANDSRLVVPTTCRPLVLHLAHTVPWAGHLAQQKTYMHVSSRFFWPSMYTEVQNYCSSCPVCQKMSAVCRSDRAPLDTLLVISTPFQRIAMDIVRPLEKSSAGYQYILVICDYATRFQEAFPLLVMMAWAVDEDEEMEVDLKA